MKKLFVSLLASLMLCTGLSQFAFAAEPVDPDNQPPTEQTGEGQTKSHPSHRKMTARTAILLLVIVLMNLKKTGTNRFQSVDFPLHIFAPLHSFLSVPLLY